MSTMAHVTYLAETIGPRGSTTPREAEAGRYAENVLRQAGLSPTTEVFVSARSSYYPYALFAGLVLASEIVFCAGGQWGAIVALALTVLAFASVLLELAFCSNPLRWILPTAKSQNVWARLEPKSEMREQVVLLGHLDSHRTPLLFSSDKWVKFLGVIVPLGMTSTLILAVIFAIGFIVPSQLWQALSLPFALVVLMLFALMLQADLTPYSPGANDNATSAAAVLSLAERLAKAPLDHTTVWALLSGCEEGGCYGAEAFARTHHDELEGAAWITLENLGGTGADPAFLTSERFLLTCNSDAHLIELAREVAARHPQLGAYAHRFRSTYTEGAIGAKHGFRVLTIAGFRRDGILPEWHRPSDTVANLDPEALQRSEAFVWEVLQEIDEQAGKMGQPQASSTNGEITR